MTKEQVRRAAVKALLEQGEPDRCHRCHNGPGDPGCGKIIHVIMDEAFMRAAQKAGVKEEDALRMIQEDNDE